MTGKLILAYRSQKWLSLSETCLYLLSIWSRWIVTIDSEDD
jgi:hypothetical protein